VVCSVAFICLSRAWLNSRNAGLHKALSWEGRAAWEVLTHGIPAIVALPNSVLTSGQTLISAEICRSTTISLRILQILGGDLLVGCWPAKNRKFQAIYIFF
jgi:hypothetical protein